MNWLITWATVNRLRESDYGAYHFNGSKADMEIEKDKFFRFLKEREGHGTTVSITAKLDGKRK